MATTAHQPPQDAAPSAHHPPPSTTAIGAATTSSTPSAAAAPTSTSSRPRREGAGRGPWYFTRDELEKESPSRREGIDLKKETFYRRSYCVFIQDAGMRLKVPQLTIATAVVFCHRFFARESFKQYDRFDMATACLFLAGKVEETPKSLRDVIHITWDIKHRKDAAMRPQLSRHKEVFDNQREVILNCERILLTTLGFDLNIIHPYKALLSQVKKIETGDKKNLAQAAWNFVNDSLRTTLCLQYEAKYIAVAAIYLACKFLKVKLSADGDNAWWVQFDVTLNSIEDISGQILDLYEQANASGKDAPSTAPKTEPTNRGTSAAHPSTQEPTAEPSPTPIQTPALLPHVPRTDTPKSENGAPHAPHAQAPPGDADVDMDMSESQPVKLEAPLGTSVLQAASKPTDTAPARESPARPELASVASFVEHADVQPKDVRENGTHGASEASAHALSNAEHDQDGGAAFATFVVAADANGHTAEEEPAQSHERDTDASHAAGTESREREGTSAHEGGRKDSLPPKDSVPKPDHDRDHDRDREHRDKKRDYDTHRDKDREHRERDHHHSHRDRHHHDRDRGREHDRERERDRDRDRERERGKDRDRDRHNREHDRSRRSREHSPASPRAKVAKTAR